MRILLTTATYPPSINGVALHVELIKREFERQGHQVLLITPKNNQKKASEKNTIYLPSIPNMLILNNYPIGIPIISQEKIISFSPQVIHTHHPVVVGNLSAKIAKKLSIPLFFTNHTSYEEYIPVYLPIGKLAAAKLTRKILNDYSKKVSRVICPSTGIESYLNSIGVQNTTVVPNGIDVDNFSPKKISNKIIKLVFVGRLEKEKRPQKIIAVANHLSKLTRFKLTVVGKGSLLPTLIDQTKKLGLSKSIIFTGSVHRNRLNNILNRHHMFISLSRSEVMPLTHIEAQACGLPIVLPESAPLDFLDKSNSISVPENNKAIAIKILESFQDQKKYTTLSKSSFKNSQKYSIEKSCNKLLKIYQPHLN